MSIKFSSKVFFHSALPRTGRNHNKLVLFSFVSDLG